MKALLLVCALLLASPLTAAQRVVSLAPSMTEMMVDLGAGDMLVGILDGGPRMPELTAVASVGRQGQLELETLLSLNPDLILLWPDSVPAAMQAQLRQFGIPLYVARPRDFQQLGAAFAALGARIGRPQQGQALQATFSERLAELRREHARETPLRVFYQVWDRPLYTVGGRQIISDALSVCGARNLFSELNLAAPQVGMETVLQRDPDVILVSNPAQVSAWSTWPQLSAVRLGQVWGVPDTGLERPSFQMLDATAKLCKLLAQARPGA